jgi:hypothetical protein
MKTYAASNTEDLSFYFGPSNDRVPDEIVKKAISLYHKDPEKLKLIIKNRKDYKYIEKAQDTYLVSKDTGAIDEELLDLPLEELLDEWVSCLKNIIEFCNYRISRNLYIGEQTKELSIFLGAKNDSKGRPITLDSKVNKIKKFWLLLGLNSEEHKKIWACHIGQGPVGRNNLIKITKSVLLSYPSAIQRDLEIYLFYRNLLLERCGSLISKDVFDLNDLDKISLKEAIIESYSYFLQYFNYENFTEDLNKHNQHGVNSEIESVYLGELVELIRVRSVHLRASMPCRMQGYGLGWETGGFYFVGEELIYVNDLDFHAKVYFEYLSAINPEVNEEDFFKKTEWFKVYFKSVSDEIVAEKLHDFKDKSNELFQKYTAKNTDLGINVTFLKKQKNIESMLKQIKMDAYRAFLELSLNYHFHEDSMKHFVYLYGSKLIRGVELVGEFIEADIKSLMRVNFEVTFEEKKIFAEEVMIGLHFEAIEEIERAPSIDFIPEPKLQQVLVDQPSLNPDESFEEEKISSEALMTENQFGAVRSEIVLHQYSFSKEKDGLLMLEAPGSIDGIQDPHTLWHEIESCFPNFPYLKEKLSLELGQKIFHTKRLELLDCIVNNPDHLGKQWPKVLLLLEHIGGEVKSCKGNGSERTLIFPKKSLEKGKKGRMYFEPFFEDLEPESINIHEKHGSGDKCLDRGRARALQEFFKRIGFTPEVLDLIKKYNKTVALGAGALLQKQKPLY